MARRRRIAELTLAGAAAGAQVDDGRRALVGHVGYLLGWDFPAHVECYFGDNVRRRLRDVSNLGLGRAHVGNIGRKIGSKIGRDVGDLGTDRIGGIASVGPHKIRWNVD
jgi:hypothetical protein